MLSNLRKNNLEIDGKIKFGATNSIRVLNDGEILRSQACIFTSKISQKKKGLNNLIKLLSR